ncbi:hypothetical protein B0H66DRAFT_571680 [Apodospora peruviana]|uniref:HMG box domain-containing protein n=1 Tax=Apodospora peruviana TaxID=516989 RepID=A0AAE0IPU3_9PEZI|nr:hypothetical protein B0H66DRAFT_571680 [Apodospora peruviana]
MTQQLETVFGELGLTQYLDVFIDQGFDSWDIILDITESDLYESRNIASLGGQILLTRPTYSDALGVKLGHRRKLQRRIANSRGVAPDASLVSPTQPSLEEPRLADAHRSEVLKFEPRDTGNPIITKRKYRRHPKPDENAPERPPSAYVLFSNKMREDLKGRNLSFTEIAKLVGENWQSLSPQEKEPFESQAQSLKDTYQSDLAEYKKTPEYKKYMAYLHDFKAKHAPPSQDKDVSKRIKLSEPGGMSGSSANATPNRTSRSGSGSSHPGSEPPPSRQQRLNSTASMMDSQHSASMTPASYHASLDDSINSPKTIKTERHSTDRSPTFSTSPSDLPPFSGRRDSNWGEDQRIDQSGGPRHLPSLSDVFESPGILSSLAPSNEANGFPFPRTHNSPGPPPGLVSGDGRIPTFRHEQSSAGSTSSSSSFGYPRTPIEGSLPIHALLGPKPNHGFETSQHQSAFQSGSSSVEQKQPFTHQGPNGMGLPMINGSTSNYTDNDSKGYHKDASVSHGPPPVTTNGVSSGYGGGRKATPPAAVNSSHERKHDSKFDGMSALLRAGEIVDQRTQ